MTRILLVVTAFALTSFLASSADARAHHLRHHGFHYGFHYGHITTDYTNRDRQLVGTR